MHLCRAAIDNCCLLCVRKTYIPIPWRCFRCRPLVTMSRYCILVICDYIVPAARYSIRRRGSFWRPRWCTGFRLMETRMTGRGYWRSPDWSCRYVGNNADGFVVLSCLRDDSVSAGMRRDQKTYITTTLAISAI